MAEPQDKSQPDSPPPLPSKPTGGAVPPQKPTARVAALGSAQGNSPYQDPFAIDEEADTDSVSRAMENAPPALLPTPVPVKPETPQTVPSQSGQTMRITIPGQEAEKPEIPVSNQGKEPVPPQPPLKPAAKSNEPALLPGAYTQQIKPPTLPKKVETADKLSQDEAQKVADAELSKFEDWLGETAETPAAGPATPPPLPPAAKAPTPTPAKAPETAIEKAPEQPAVTPPPLPPKAKSPEKPAVTPPSLPPKAKAPEKPVAPKAPEKKSATPKVDPPKLSTVAPVTGGTAPASKERKPVDMPKLKMLDKKPQKLLSRQRREKEKEQEARRREARQKVRFSANVPPEQLAPKADLPLKPDAEEKPKESAKDETPPALPVKEEKAATSEKTPAAKAKPEPKEKTEAKPSSDQPATEKKEQKEAPSGKPEAAKPQAKGVAANEPEAVTPQAKEVAPSKPKKAVETAMPTAKKVEKVEPSTSEKDQDKEGKVPLPAVVPVSLKKGDKPEAPAKPTKSKAKTPESAKPKKANQAEVAKPVKAEKADKKVEPVKPEKAKKEDEPASKGETKLAATTPAKTLKPGQEGFKNLDFPTVDHKNKKPAPLLSRQRKEQQKSAAEATAAGAAGKSRGTRERATKSPAPRQLAAAPAQDTKPEKPASKPMSSGQKIAIRVVTYVVVIAAVLGLGYGSYYLLRETKVVGKILVKPGSGFKIEEVAVVRDFRDDLRALAVDLAEERGPLRREIRDLERNVALAKEDMVGREARLQYLREDIIKAQEEIETVLGEARNQAEAIWSGPGQELDDEYAGRLNETKERIQRRADQLQLNYSPSDEFESPEVWVNAFRLALYDAPTGVNPAQERLWAESVLREWQEYNGEWRLQLVELKKQVQGIQSKPREQIEDIRRNIAELKARIARTEAEIQPLRDEITFTEARLQERREMEASLEEPKYKQVLQAANTQMILKPLPFDPGNNRFEWNNILADLGFQPGEYLLWVRATRGGEEFWAFAKFPIIKDTTTQLIIDQTQLQSVREALRETAKQGSLLQ